MLKADGDTAVYIEYAHARAESVLRRAREAKGVDVAGVVAAAAGAASAGAAAALFSFEHASELTLAADLMRVQDVLATVQEDLMPHRLCEYLYGLAARLTDFYRDCNILGADTAPALRDSRLRLLTAVALVMKKSLALLGIRALDKI
jgi:arginyl-tRNA synthetase